MLSAAATTALVGPSAKPTKSWWLDRLPADALPPALAAPPRTAKAFGCMAAAVARERATMIFSARGAPWVLTDVARRCAALAAMAGT